MKRSLKRDEERQRKMKREKKGTDIKRDIIEEKRWIKVDKERC